jgi:hypothetical protein
MRPLIRSGQYVFIEKARPLDLTPGDAVCYRENGGLFLHRIWALRSGPAGRSFLIGDDGAVIAPHEISSRQVVGRLRGGRNGLPGLIGRGGRTSACREIGFSSRHTTGSSAW